MRDLIDDDFIRSLGETLTPGSSALFILVRRATPNKVLSELRPFGGRVIYTSLSTESSSSKTASSCVGSTPPSLTYRRGSTDPTAPHSLVDRGQQPGRHPSCRAPGRWVAPTGRPAGELAPGHPRLTRASSGRWEGRGRDSGLA